MGSRCQDLAAEFGFDTTIAFDRSQNPQSEVPVDCLIDFSRPEALIGWMDYVMANPMPVVTGTTGLSERDFKLLDRLSEVVPVLWASNFCIGVFVLRELAKKATQLLAGFDFDIELVETHHKHKVDTPSGTALTLANTVIAAREDILQIGHRPHGNIGARHPSELAIHSIRGGSVVGEHELIFLGEGESLHLRHLATDRDVFVRGALKVASLFAAGGYSAGRYQLRDILQPYL